MENLEQVTESKLDILPEEKDDSVPSTIRIDEGGLIPTESVPKQEQDENEQEVQQVQQQDFQEVQDVQDVQYAQDAQDVQNVKLATTTDDNSDEDVQSTEQSVEDQSQESWFCSVFGCNKS